jgi:glycosyl-4,4'-diaponeurosporenoate acyltransferase
VERAYDRNIRQPRMRIVYLPTFWNIIIDCIAWFIIHIGVARLAVTIPIESIQSMNWLCQNRSWELEGKFYSHYVAVRKWKHLLPDGASFLGEKGFPKKRLEKKDNEYLNLFLYETCRAELTHWIIMLFGPLFFLWNPIWVGFLMVGYAVIENLPLIMAQRYNRVRLVRVLEREKPRR